MPYKLDRRKNYSYVGPNLKEGEANPEKETFYGELNGLFKRHSLDCVTPEVFATS
jgi:hypothetical protein